MKPRFFKTADAFREWLEKNHDKETELSVGFHKKNSGKPSITYPEALDEALCFGWIDGVRRNVNETSYSIRFTPRKTKSIWSVVNMRRATELENLGLMRPPGLRAFQARDPKRSGIYSFENAARELDPEFEKRFRANKKAWDFFQAQPPYITKVCKFWVMSAKKEETRLRRLDQLIASSAKGQRRGVMTSNKNTKQ
jgi:uncharacterized protein YdeI (YjbR/CyaY-like superfamily)